MQCYRDFLMFTMDEKWQCWIILDKAQHTVYNHWMGRFYFVFPMKDSIFLITRESKSFGHFLEATSLRKDTIFEVYAENMYKKRKQWKPPALTGSAKLVQKKCYNLTFLPHQEELTAPWQTLKVRIWNRFLQILFAAEEEALEISLIFAFTVSINMA